MMLITNIKEFDAVLDAGEFAWPGGYPLYFITSDSEALSFAAAMEEADQIRAAFDLDYRDQWKVVAVDINWEDNTLFCVHTEKKIGTAYRY